MESNECIIPANLVEGFSSLRRNDADSVFHRVEEDDGAVGTTASSRSNESAPRVLSHMHVSRVHLSDSNTRSRAHLSDAATPGSVSAPREQSTHSSEADSSALVVIPSSPQDGPSPTEAESISTEPDQFNAHRMVTRAKDGIHKPKYPFVGIHTDPRLLPQASEPSSVLDALRISHWKLAMEDEFQALQRNKTWVLVPRDTSQKLIDCKWVFKVKFKQDGTILKHKARLVAKGFQQAPGLDYGETFSPVVKPTTIRVVLAVAVTSGWEIRQLDVNNAFLNGYLQEDVFMRQPEGFEDPKRPTHVCKLVKALYGLKQAPRAWFDRLRITLLSWGFQNAKSDVSLFFFRSSTVTVYILVYVDDILVTGNNPKFLKSFIAKLNTMFSLKDLGSAYYFLGIEINRHEAGLHLCQSKYTLDILKKFNMLDCAPVPTPMVTGRQFSKTEGEPLKDPTMFRQAIGSLQYLINTRPDIAFSVNKLSQFLSCPTDVHFQGVKRILIYLKGTYQYGINIEHIGSLTLSVYTDADWATDVDDRKSMAGIFVFLGNTLVSWGSRKQKVVSRSSTESEYRALADGAAELRWLYSLITELGLHLKTPTVLW